VLTLYQLDDLPPMMFIKESANSHGFVDARVIEQKWKDHFSYCYREYPEGFCMPITRTCLVDHVSEMRRRVTRPGCCMGPKDSRTTRNSWSSPCSLRPSPVLPQHIARIA
jgi:hypothetical protein